MEPLKELNVNIIKQNVNIKKKEPYIPTEKLDIIQVSDEIFQLIINNVVQIKDVDKDTGEEQKTSIYKKNLDVKKSYKGYDCFLFEDGRGGFCVNQETKELCNVFSIENGRGKELLRNVKSKYSELKLDCFDGFLVQCVYTQPTHKEDKCFFEIQKRDKNWDPNGPDIVYMSYENPELKKLLSEKIVDKKEQEILTLDKLSLFLTNHL